MTVVKLSALLDGICSVSPDVDCDITGLSLDSRHVKAGDLFFACQGTHLDGRQFIDEAVRKGARVVLVEGASSSLGDHRSPLRVIVPCLNHRIGQVAANFFGHPAKSLRIVGITGTNGKTSCSHFIGSLLHQFNIPCGIIGTLGSGLYGHIRATGLTTPDAITLQATFAEFVKQKVNTVAMEVSSHSIDQGRINGIPFDVGIFTNLTRDHLDYHGDMKSYGAVKKRLFENDLLRQAVINADDVFGLQMIESLSPYKSIFAYASNQLPVLSSSIPLIYADQVQLDMTGIKAEVHTPWGGGLLHSSLVGQFNLNNLLAVLTTLCLLEIPLTDILHAIAALQPVAGRMETVGGGDKPLVVVDYAHTPDALEKVLIALRRHVKGKLYCVFGCGGERDRGKRPIMAKMAEQYADYVVVTDDNPRHEDPEQIVADIICGFVYPTRVIVQHDRSTAIQDVIQCATKEDTILIAGKGAETYQQIGDMTVPFSDIEKVRTFLS